MRVYRRSTRLGLGHWQPSLVSLTLLAAVPVSAQEGVTFKRELPAVGVTPAPVIDGDLSDAAWQEAARADRFTDPLYGNPLSDQTVAYLGYDSKNIYIAFYAHDSQPQSIVARQTKRGSSLQGDDRVAVSFEFFHTHRVQDRSYFVVNPRGTQSASLAVGLSSQILRHEEDSEQHVLTFNCDFSPQRGIVGRVLSGTGGTGGYVAYRRSGYGGVETFFILGDPNAREFTPRLVAKVVWPM